MLPAITLTDTVRTKQEALLSVETIRQRITDLCRRFPNGELYQRADGDEYNLVVPARSSPVETSDPVVLVFTLDADERTLSVITQCVPNRNRTRSPAYRKVSEREWDRVMDSFARRSA